MARRSRMGSDPLSNKTDKGKKKKKDDLNSTEGVDALIRDTRASAGTAKGKKKAAAKKKASTEKKKATVKKKTSFKKKKPAASVTPAQAKAKKKPAPAIKPGAVIDLALPHETEALQKPGKAHAPATQDKAVITQKAAPAVTKKEEKTTPPPVAEKKAAVKSAARKPEKAEQSAPAPVKKERPKEKAATGRSPEGKPAKSGKSTDEQVEMEQFLAFRLAAESFAFEIERVREVLAYTKVTKVPNTPDFMSGVINLRGNVVPVVDLRLLFGLGLGEMTEDTCIIIVEVVIDNETLEIGAKADAVREVFDIKKDDIEPAPTLGEHLDTEFLLGMGKKGGEFLLLLDIEKVFSMDNLIRI
ncbi:MAG: chemotaxis protein CheW [Thermodesulfovibrionales bacterium]|nr:chemotaxis protein CheW [Thermodesulfovibrionales bacterium]